jgi:hypothetical protein
MRTGQPHLGRLLVTRRDADVEICSEPLPDGGGNFLLGAKLSEYHTGYRGFSKELLQKLDLSKNSDDFVFDNQMLAQTLWHGFTIGEVSCPTKYFKEVSSINFQRSVKYGFGCLDVGLKFRLAKMGMFKSELFP